MVKKMKGEENSVKNEIYIVSQPTAKFEVLAMNQGIDCEHI